MNTVTTYKPVTSLDAPPLFSPHEAACWACGYNQALDAFATRLRAAEFLLLEADACIDILLGDSGNERGRELLAAIERHCQSYPEPLE